MTPTHDVVLADDHRLIRHALRKLIEADGKYRVVGEADNGRDAVALIRTATPDIVVMDIGMPELNGVEACRQVMRDYPKTRVVALSSYTDRRHVSGMLDAGAVGYIPKDAAADELMRALDAVSRGRSYLSPEITRILINAHTGRSDSRADPLGVREREVLQLLAEGQTSGEIAASLHIATSTADTHRRNLMKKLNIHSVAELTKYAIREGLTALE